MTTSTAKHQHDDTSLSLLEQAKDNVTEAWSQFENLYRPLICFWCRNSGLQPASVEDVSQDVFLLVSRKLTQFHPDGRPGSFRRWLRQIARNAIIDSQRRIRPGHKGMGGSDAVQQIQRIAAPTLPEPDDEADATEESIVLLRAVELIRSQCTERDFEIFWRVNANGERVMDVAADLGITANAVSQVIAKVKQKVLKNFGDLLDDD